MLMPGTSKVMHACLKIGSSKLFLCDENENMKAPKGGQAGRSFTSMRPTWMRAINRPKPLA
jgi:uncharacterized glyoxalase superfamily protein PhnB